MKKILRDVLKYVVGTTDFSPVEYRESKLLYPVCLNFTLKDFGFYYSPLDADGIPYRVYQSVGAQYNPTRIAAYGLAHYNRFAIYNNVKDKEVFLKCADWFLNITNARYEYGFDWEDLKAPWISCMAQGEAASVLVRAFKLTGNEEYLRHASLALEPLFISINDGGVQSQFVNGDLFVEEYPSKSPTHVLNGFLFAVIGLKEFSNISESSRHEVLFEKFCNTILKNIDIWSDGKWSLYESKTKTVGINKCTPPYHNLQITQLKWVNNIINSAELDNKINLWESGLNCMLNRIMALVGKVQFRLKNRAQR